VIAIRVTRWMAGCLALLGLGLNWPARLQAAPIVWTTASGGNGHAYESVGQATTWEAAKIAANGMTFLGMSGHLATITSQAENDFIVANFSNPQFLGGYQLDGATEPAGGWAWVTGEPWSYTNWAPGEPNNLSGIEKYLEYFAGGPRWNDISGAETRTYVVEYDTPEPPALALFTLGLIGLLQFARKRIHASFGATLFALHPGSPRHRGEDYKRGAC
jgi:hypothetical protein